MSKLEQQKARLQDSIEQNFNPHLESLIEHCTALRSLLEIKSDQEVLEDLKRVVKSTVELGEIMRRLSIYGFPDTREEGIQPEAKIRHELRTPLNAIIGYTEIIFDSVAQQPDQQPDKQYQSYYSAIISSANALMQEIDAIGASLPPSGSLLGEGLISSDELSSQLQRISQQTDAKKLVGRLLVVDDIEENRQLLKRHLLPDGHEISVADSGKSAMEMIKYQEFDLILLDIMMPGMNGVEVLEKLKESEQHKQIPIIVISGLGDMDAVAPCIAAGAEDYLTKPFNPVLLRARINSSIQKKKWADKEKGYLSQIEHEKQRTEDILQAILPTAIIDRLKKSDEPIADRFENVTVMFADIVGFTAASERKTPDELLEWLVGLFSEFDRLADEHGVEKIKTIGDAYMVACGVPLPEDNHVDRVLAFAESILTLSSDTEPMHDPFKLRIGIHSGPVVAGLVGRHRYVYDLWGETVNIASRIESSGIENRVCVSTVVAEQASSKYRFESRGEVRLKGVGATEILMLV